MEEIVEKVKMDKSGRIVVPSRIRKRTGMEKKEDFKLIVTRGELILRPVIKNKKEIEKWYKEMKKSRLEWEGRTGKKEKWISEKYAKRKLSM